MPSSDSPMGTFAKMFSPQEVFTRLSISSTQCLKKKILKYFLHLNLSFHLVTGEGGWQCGRRPRAREGAFSGAVQERRGALCSGWQSWWWQFESSVQMFVVQICSVLSCCVASSRCFFAKLLQGVFFLAKLFQGVFVGKPSSRCASTWKARGWLTWPPPALIQLTLLTVFRSVHSTVYSLQQEQ